MRQQKRPQAGRTLRVFSKVETGGKHNIAPDQLLAPLHLFVQVRVANHPGGVAHLAESLVQACLLYTSELPTKA